MKLCSKCGIRKDEESGFHKTNSTVDGYHTLCKPCRRGFNAKYITQMRAKIVARLGSRCVSPNCRWQNLDGTWGCTDLRALQIDHLVKKDEGNGMLTAKYVREILSWPDAKLFAKFQLLCACCNWIKRYTDHEISAIDS
jgi:hypothetical protein